MIRTSLTSAVAAGALVALLAMPAAAADTARVRVIHASPDAPAVDVYLDGAKVDALTNVPFGAISEYLEVPAGDHGVQVFPTGTTETAVIDADLSLSSGGRYTIAATDPVASIKATVLEDEPAAAAGKAQVRVVHLSPDAPAVDVAPDGADPVVSDLAYPDATDYLALDPGSYDLEVRPAGSMDVALQLNPLDLAGDTAYSVFAVGSAASEPLGGNELKVIVAMDAMTPPDTSTTATDGASSFPMLGVGLAALVAAVVLVATRRRLATTSR